MTLLGTKNLGKDVVTDLDRQLQIWQITIDGKSEVILVVYDIVLLAPNGSIAKVESTDNFRRFNRDAVIQDEIEVKPANLKFDALKLSPVGQAILGMLQLDLNLIQSFETLAEDLRQD